MKSRRTHKQVVRVRQIASDSEQFLEIVELAVDVSANRHGALYDFDVVLSTNNFLCLRFTLSTKNPTCSHNSISADAGSSSLLRNRCSLSSISSDTGCISSKLLSAGKASIPSLPQKD